MKRGDEILIKWIGATIMVARVTKVSGVGLQCRCGYEERVKIELLISDRGITWSPAWREKEVSVDSSL